MRYKNVGVNKHYPNKTPRGHEYNSYHCHSKYRPAVVSYDAIVSSLIFLFFHFLSLPSDEMIVRHQTLKIGGMLFARFEVQPTLKTDLVRTYWDEPFAQHTFIIRSAFSSDRKHVVGVNRTLPPAKENAIVKKKKERKEWKRNERIRSPWKVNALKRHKIYSFSPRQKCHRDYYLSNGIWQAVVP